MKMTQWHLNSLSLSILVALGGLQYPFHRCNGWAWADDWLITTSIAYSWRILLQKSARWVRKNITQRTALLQVAAQASFGVWACETADPFILGVFRAKKQENSRSKFRSRKDPVSVFSYFWWSGSVNRLDLQVKHDQTPTCNTSPSLNSSFIFLILLKSNKNPPGLVRGYNSPGLCGPADFGGSAKEDLGSSVSHRRRQRQHGWQPRRPWGGPLSWRLSHAATLQGPTRGSGGQWGRSGSLGCLMLGCENLQEFSKCMDNCQAPRSHQILRAIFPGTPHGGFHGSTKGSSDFIGAAGARGNLLVALLGARLPLCRHWSLLGEGAKGDSMR